MAPAALHLAFSPTALVVTVQVLHPVRVRNIAAQSASLIQLLSDTESVADGQKINQPRKRGREKIENRKKRTGSGQGEFCDGSTSGGAFGIESNASKVWTQVSGVGGYPVACLDRTCTFSIGGFGVYSGCSVCIVPRHP